MNLINTNDTQKMLNELKKAWHTDGRITVLPKGYTKPDPKWDKVEDKDMEIVRHYFHPDPIRPVSEIWEVLLHGDLKVGVVLNKHGYHIEQLYYNKHDKGED